MKSTFLFAGLFPLLLLAAAADMPEVIKVEFAADGKIPVAKGQPDFVLLDGSRKGGDASQ